jgi:NTE family protein
MTDASIQTDEIQNLHAPIENLVFSGGGLKGIAYTGCIQALEEFDILKDIKRVSATSVGSLFSFGMLLGYTSSQIKELVFKVDLTFLKDINADNLLNFPVNFGIDSGDKIEKILAILIKKKGYLPEINFQQFYEVTKIDFIVVGSCVNKQIPCYFNYKTWPKLSVLKAIRISCGFPFLYNAVKLEDDIYVDGCLFENTPVSCFKDEMEKTMVFRINNNVTYEHKLSNYIMNMFGCLSTTLTNLQLEQYYTYLVNLDIHLNATTEITDPEKEQIIQEGCEKTKQYLLQHKELLKLQSQTKPKYKEIKINYNSSNNNINNTNTNNKQEKQDMDSMENIKSFSLLTEEINDILNFLE